MSSQSDVNIVSFNIGALSNDTRLLFQAPTDANGGGISILEATAHMAAASSASLTLVKHSSAATPALNGTIGAAVGGTATPFADNVPKAYTISTPFVDAGEWVAVVEGNVAAANAITVVTVSYVMGR